MKPVKKGSTKTAAKKLKGIIGQKTKKRSAEKIEDVKKLMRLLQVRQLELEHINQELRIAKQELEISHNKYANLFDYSPIPFITLDQNGLILEVNLGACKLFEIKKSKFIGQQFINNILLEEKNKFNSFINALYNSTSIHSCELKVINIENRIIKLLLKGLQINDALESNKKYQLALIDLTENERIQESLQNTSEEHKIPNAGKDKFLSIIAHDLRSPFQSLLSASKMLAEEYDSLSREEIILCSQGLNNNIRNIYSLLDNLLNWSMMQRNMFEFEQENLNLHNLVSKVIEVSLDSALKKNVSVFNNVSSNASIYADAEMLRSVIQNLVINAIKFNRQDGKVTVTCTSKDKIVEVTVEDTGIGIEEGVSSNLFNLDTLSSTNGTAGEKGSGLGLLLCKEFIEKHGGKIWIESEVGKGTKVSFTLPQ